MDRLVLRGSQSLCGTVHVSGAKNSALPCLTAALLTDQVCTLRRVPAVRDVGTMQRLLGTLGVAITEGGASDDGTGDIRHLQTIDRREHVAPYHLVRQMRASVCVMGPLLARRGKARVAMPGGCQIGHRPIDLHLRGLAALGAEVRFERGDVVLTGGSLRGATVDLTGPAGPTVTGTCNVVAAAVLADGRTIIRGAAVEPEVKDFVALLRSMGAQISWGDDARIATLEIDGVDELASFDHEIIGDRIEAATWASCIAAAGGHVAISGVRVGDLQAVLDVLTACGVSVIPDLDGFTVKRSGALSAVDVEAHVFPGVPSDVQAQLAAVLTQCAGESSIQDFVFPDRFGYLSELARLGARVKRTAIGGRVYGATKLFGTDVLASDLRASAALVVAALAAEGETVIRRVYHLDRGYERLVEKLTAIGGLITRERDEYEF